MKSDDKPESLDAIETAAARWTARRDVGSSPDDERELQAWLAADPRHREVLAFHDATWSALVRPAAVGNAASLRAQLEKLATRRRARRRIATLAAVAGLAVLSVVTFRRAQSTPTLTTPASFAEVVTPERKTFPDGSVAELKENARIGVEFDARTRRIVLLAGEAHFAVQSDAGRPFVVAAGGIEVRAVGTAFSVRKETAAVEVIVTHGTVALEQPSAYLSPKPPQLATLDAGMLAVVELHTAPVPAIRSIPPTELSQRLAWRGPRLEFSRTPLAEAINLFNRHAPSDSPRLAIGDAETAALRISGVFRADNAEAFVSLLETAFEVQVQRTERTVFLRRAR
jgi:transmembrane sensor